MTGPVQPTAGRPGLGPSRGSRARAGDVVFRFAILAGLVVGVGVLAVLVASVVRDGWSRLDERLVTGFASVDPAAAGAQAALVGTLWVIAVTAVVTVPLGVGAAIYLEEYARRDSWHGRIIEANIQNLAAVPSIVYGILGLAIFARALALGNSVLAAGLTLGLLVLPTVVIASREAIRSVPTSIRHAAIALGATRWQTVSRQVLPAALPGIVTGVLLALSRAIGEAAPLVLLGGLTFVTFNPSGPMSPFTVLPIQIYNWISRPQEEFHALAAASIVLLLLVLVVINAAAIGIRRRYRRTW